MGSLAEHLGANCHEQMHMKTLSCQHWSHLQKYSVTTKNSPSINGETRRVCLHLEKEKEKMHIACFPCQCVWRTLVAHKSKISESLWAATRLKGIDLKLLRHFKIQTMRIYKHTNMGENNKNYFSPSSSCLPLVHMFLVGGHFQFKSLWTGRLWLKHFLGPSSRRLRDQIRSCDTIWARE